MIDEPTPRSVAAARGYRIIIVMPETMSVSAAS